MNPVRHRWLFSVLSLSASIALAADGQSSSSGDVARITQAGSFNHAIILQGVSETDLTSSSSADIDQNGDLNIATSAQDGWDNETEIVQTGDHNMASVTQIGSGDYAAITQTGDAHSAIVVQYGSGHYVDISQKN